MRTMEAENVIEMLHITKEFPGIIANDDITLQLRRGEIHALLGENGAGKSTLMSVLFGLYQPEAGEIKKNGKVVKINNPNDATALGIGMVHQHFQLVDVFTVLDNIILGAETTKLGFLQKKEARKKVEALSEKYGLKVDLDARVENITVGMQQRVEILKMLYRDNEILIFDEPTAVLTPQEIDELMATMKEFAKEGKSILFISHKLNEIMAVADRVTVLRKGKYIGTVHTADTDPQKLTEMMVGRAVSLNIDRPEAKYRDLRLEVKGLTCRDHEGIKTLDDVSFQAFGGEILGIAGIAGSGQKELLEAIAGLQAAEAGSAYNVEAGAIDRMYVNLTGLTDYHSEAAAGGTDAESDAALLARIRERVQRPPTSGNGYQYRQWAMEVAGVGSAKVVELPGGPGTVGVTLVDSNDRAPSEEIVEAVEAHIEEERPVGAAVTVAAATEREVTVAAQVSLTGGAGAGAVQDAFRAALAGYLHTLIEGKYGAVYYKPADDQPYTLLYNRVLALLLNVEGVEDFASLTVNGGTADVTIQAGEIPVLGEVSVT